MPPRPVVLVVLDGWGLAPPGPGNAITAARTPVFDRLWTNCRHATLRADGEYVGLMPGQMGNSNVGHLNIGAGRIVYQDLVRIHRAARDGTLRGRLEQHGLLSAPRLHLLGLCSDGGVHSHLDHWNAILALREGHGTTLLHLFLDGRDVPPKSAHTYLTRLERHGAEVATVMGRFYAMDRDRRWERTELAYRAVVGGEAPYRAVNAEAAVDLAYERGESDEFVSPTVIGGYRGAEPSDLFLMINFRADRARQLSRALADPSFDAFPRRGVFRLHTMTEYDRSLPLPVLFPPEALHGTLGEVLAARGLRQFRVAETEKYAHVTYFLNGGREEPFAGEERVLVPSPKVRTYDLVPEMSAEGVALATSQAIRSGSFDVVVVNFANPDMVGHTGDFGAAVRAVEAVDRCLGDVLAAVQAVGGVALIIADHGNAECMLDPETGGAHTAHTTNPVPVVLFDPTDQARDVVGLRDGILADVAPTLLDLLQLPRPAEMTGQSLLLRGRPRITGERGSSQ